MNRRNLLLEAGDNALLETSGLILLQDELAPYNDNLRGVAVQTDVRCASGTTVAFFGIDSLVECQATFSPTELETLTFTVARTDARVAELTIGRVVRTTFANAANDREWDILTIADSNRSDFFTVTAVPIALRLSRAVVTSTNNTTGQVTVDYTGVQLTATEWVNTVVLPALSAAGLSWISLGTVNATNRFDLSGEWSSALEVVEAVMDVGKANGEWRLRRNGDTGYLLDLLTAVGSDAPTVYIRTGTNLDETKRERSLVDVATRLYPRGGTDKVEQTMADHLWRIKTVVSGTVLELEDPAGGAGPIAYDDQLNGTYLAVMNSITFASTLVTDSVAATQRVTIASTTGMSAGQWVRFFAGSTVTGARLVSLTHPTLSATPANGGLGDRGQILDRPTINGETNLVENGTQRKWTTSANPPDGWGEYAVTPANVAFTKETSDVLYTGTPVTKIVTTGTSSGAVGDPLEIAPDGVFAGAVVFTQQPGAYVQTAEIPVWKTDTRKYTATVWLKVNDSPAPSANGNPRVYMYLHDTARADFATKPVHPSLQAGLIGTWDLGEGSDRGAWLRFQSEPFDLSSFVDFGVSEFNQYHDDIPKIAGNVRVRVELAGGDTGTSTQDDEFLYPNFLGTWSSAATYSPGDVVKDNDGTYDEYHKCLIANTNKKPDSHPSDWLRIWSQDGTQRYRGQNVASGWEVLVGPVTVSETAAAIEDRDYSGATELWQAANAALPRTSNVVKGYDLTVADLAREDATLYADFVFQAGGNIILQDVDLGEVATLRLLEYSPDYLRPLNSQIRVGQPPDRLTDYTEGLQTASQAAAAATSQQVQGAGSGGPEGPAGPAGPPGPAGASPWSLSGSDTYYNAGNVAIGTATPVAGTRTLIVGSGTTGSTYGLVVQNNAGSSTLLVSDAGDVSVPTGTLNATNPIAGSITGNAATATKFAASVNINGVAFDGSANITVTADAGTLTGSTLASGVTASSLTSVGTIATGIWQGTSVGKDYGGTGLTSTAFSGITNERVFVYDGGTGAFEVGPTGSNGQALVYSGGALAWGNPAPGSHVLADATGLGAEHTVAGLTSGMILQATGATTARFQIPSIPASSVTAGTFGGTSYTITNDLTVSGTFSASVAWSDITGEPSYFPADLTSVSGTLGMANGGTNNGSWPSINTGEYVVLYDSTSGAQRIETLALGSNGQALIVSGGALAWGNATPSSHVLADATGLGSEHTVSGLTTGMILQATGATTARFQTPSIPASSVTAGTFGGASYTITNDLTVSGTFTASVAWSSITSTPTTISGYGITDGVSTGGSYNNPTWITGLAGSKISGDISGNAAGVTGTVPINKGGTNKTSYTVSGTGTRVLVYDSGTGAFDVVSAGSSGQFLRSSGTTGDVIWATPPNFTDSAAGYAPASGGGTSNFLRADGTWAAPPSTTTIAASGVTAGTFPGALYTFTDSIALSGAITLSSDVAISRGAANRLDLASGDSLNLVSGSYQIGGTNVLTSNTLGSGVTASSLTSVGTINSGTWQGSPISDAYLATISTAGKVANSATTADSANTASAIVARDGSGNFTATTITATLSGNASTATTLQTPRNINGVAFNGSTDITVTAAAGTLTGNTLASGVTASSLTSVGTLTALTVTNAVTANDFVLSSDRRRKTDLEPLTDVLGKLAQITGYTYRPIDGGRRRAGVMAQDVEGVLPEAVYTDAEGYKTLSYEQLIPLLVEAVKLLASR